MFLSSVRLGQIILLTAVFALLLLAVHQWRLNRAVNKYEKKISWRGLIRPIGISVFVGSAFSGIAALLAVSHFDESWRFLPMAPGFFLALFVASIHGDGRNFEIAVFVANGVPYGLISFVVYRLLLEKREPK